MTVGSALGAGQTTKSNRAASGQQTSCPTSSTNSSAASGGFNPSLAFQQVKQTQASLARLARVHQQIQCQNNTQSSQQHAAKSSAPSDQVTSTSGQQQQQVVAAGNTIKSTTFVDCLIRRFKDCFNEDCCSVPMFVVGNLSPGSDGTHLILPPCVSLACQNMSRFASPKNLRHMNSIRDSCKSIEELDLGSNKLNDLIEVYKILQCTPNLKFLNLSENDLSRTSPVAMAATSSSTFTTTTAIGYSPAATQLPVTPSPSSVATNNNHNQQQSSQPIIAFGSSVSNSHHWSPQQQQPVPRSFLAPLNSNQLGGRRHSTLGQSSSSTAAATPPPPTTTTTTNASATTTTTTGSPHMQVASNRATRLAATSRMAEARRLAATKALAQSKKTSASLVAGKLNNSVIPVSPTSGPRDSPTGSVVAPRASCGIPTSNSASALASEAASGSRDAATGSRQTAAADLSPQRLSSAGGKSPRTSTMQLARSLSSLSSKDIHASLGNSVTAGARRQLGTTTRAKLAATSRSSVVAQVTQPQAIPTRANQQATSRLRRPTVSSRLASSSSAGVNRNRVKSDQVKPEPIVETEGDLDVDMMTATGTTNTVATAVPPTSLSVATTATTSTSAMTSHRLQTNSNNSSSGNNNSTNQTITGSNQQQASQFRRTFESIKALALNNTGCQWRVVCSILSRMPNLEELHLSLNNYERIDLEPQEFKHFSLKRLYLCNNPKLTNFEEVNKLLLAFPALEALSIADCNISQIPDNLNLAKEWKRICGLNINGWPIKEWPIIERLNQLPSLIDLKCRNLEILSTIDEPRHHLIARLPKLQRLNGSEIEEREHAEKEFLKFFMINSHLERPSRFHELIQIHGEIKPSVDVDLDLSPPSQAQVKVIYLNRNYFMKENEDDILMSEDFLVNLMSNIENATTSSGPNNHHQENQSMEVVEFEQPKQPVRLFKDDGQEVLAVEVDLRQSVRKFKSMLANLFGLESQNLILYYIDHEMVGLMGPELIKHNQKKLWNYNVQDGDQFIVEER